MSLKKKIEKEIIKKQTGMNSKKNKHIQITDKGVSRVQPIAES